MDRSNDRVRSDGEPLTIFARATLVAWVALMTVLCFTIFTWIVHDRRMPGWPHVLDRAKHGPLVEVAGHNVALAVAIDGLLFTLFGLIHAGFARRAVSVLTTEHGGLYRARSFEPCS